MDKSDWVIVFVEQLLMLRPNMTLTVADAIAFQQWARHGSEAPHATAIKWAEDASAIAELSNAA